ncbi:ATP-binding cassette domain-containing protein [Peptacetobacter hominis]|uniref:ABC-type quaternary amine transporter n=1 Tax=Peptacetobacter hominis TaxID=2743610 RepID=A0A544QWS6_9FIRM|nr:ATP-binding cassette domain-containing protein [Peptacetobacter hominis]TQQ85148.1 ATP-binding cassette domain-containing protein [Peptacetobacter hominis]
MAFLEVKNIVKVFDKQTALNDVSLEIEKGEFISILGPSGCGKTTLLRIIAGLEKPSDGSIFINGKDCTELDSSKRNFGIVFQSYALFPNMTVEQNILFGLEQRKEVSKKERVERCREVLEMVDLYEHRKKYPFQLSGGQQQRTALARAISLKPEYLLLDEPLSALDAKVRSKLRTEICNIQKKLGITTIMVTHDQEEALTMADRIVVMNNSVIEQIGTPGEIYRNPKSAFVADFIGSMNIYREGKHIYGIRPEKIIMSSMSIDGMENRPGTVTNIEFRGATTRVYGECDDRKEICVDLMSDEVSEIDFNKGDRVVFNYTKDDIVSYLDEEVV